MADLDLMNADQQLTDAMAAQTQPLRPQASFASTPIVPGIPAGDAQVSPQTLRLQEILNNVQQTSSAIATSQAQRAEQLNTTTADALNKIAEADENLAGNASSPWRLLLEDFDDTYSRSTQNRKKRDALQSISTQTAVNKAYQQSDKLKLQAAKAPMEMLQFIQNFKKGGLDMKVSELNLIQNNRKLQKDLREQKQDQLTLEEAQAIEESGDYPADFPQSFIQDKLVNHQKLLDDAESAADARRAGKFALAERKENYAIDKIGIADGRMLMQQAQKAGVTSIDLGDGASLPVHKIQARVAKLAQDEFDQETQLANRMTELSKFASRDTAVVNDAISTALSTAMGSAGVELPETAALMNMPEEELIQQDLFNKLPTDVATATFDVVRSRNRLNEQLQTKAAGPAAIKIYNDKVAELEKITKAHNEDFIKGGTTKARQAARRELVRNRMQVSNPNQGAMLLADTGLAMPNFRGNEALRKGFEQFVLQYGEQKGVSGKASAMDDSPEAQEARVEALMAKFMSPDFSKTTDHEELLKAINARAGDNVYSVKETILNEQSAKMFEAAMVEMAQADSATGVADPALQKLLFNADGSPSQAWFNDAGQKSQKSILLELVNLGKTAKNDASFYVGPLNDALNKTMDARMPEMEGFSAPNAQSFMKMVFPFEEFSTLVDRKLNKNLRITLGNAIHDANKPVVPVDPILGSFF